MVVVGDFSVKLVNAETNAAFQEHVGPNEAIYAEVEPNAEYYIEIQVVGGRSGQVARFECCIDGKWLPYYTPLQRKNGPYQCGLYAREKRRETTTNTVTAFRFRKPDIDPALISGSNQLPDGNAAPPPDMMMGSITVKVFEGIYRGVDPAEDFEMGFKSNPVDSSLCTNENEAKKVIRTDEGKISKSNSTTARFERFEPGKLLGEINIRYCTTLGLVYAGVLTKPPHWELHRLKHGLPRCNNDDTTDEMELSVPDKKFKIKALYRNGVMITAEREVDMFDLTTSRDE